MYIHDVIRDVDRKKERKTERKKDTRGNGKMTCIYIVHVLTMYTVCIKHDVYMHVLYTVHVHVHFLVHVHIVSVHTCTCTYKCMYKNIIMYKTQCLYACILYMYLYNSHRLVCTCTCSCTCICCVCTYM